MKERTYGWYPAVRDIYLSKGQPTPYHLECLYKFKDSGYYNPLAQPPEPELMIRGLTPTPSLPPSRPGSFKADPWASRKTKSVSAPKFKPAPKLSIPTPQQCWSKSLAETQWGVVTPEATPAPPETAPPPQGKDEKKMHVHWPTQKIQGKYDRPYVPPRTPSVFGTPMPPPDPQSTLAGSGYVFVPTGDGGMQVYSPPPFSPPEYSKAVSWPEPHPKRPSPQRSASSVASLGSEEGQLLRRQYQEQFEEEWRQEDEEKQKKLAKQQQFERMVQQQRQQQQQQQQQKKKIPQPPRSATSARATPSVRKERIKSATTYRQKPQVPKRPVYSAGPVRPGAESKQLNTVHEWREETTPAPREMRDARAWEESYTVRSESPCMRPRAPLPPTPSLEDLAIEEDLFSCADYDEAIEKYGWLAEVHGDPYNLKKTTKRLPYTVKCAEPEIPAEPPGVHMENMETFFQNTIPRRNATFDVHKEWISESIHAKRLELQKRQGLKHCWKNFSFVY